MRTLVAVLPLVLVAAAPPPGEPRVYLLTQQLGADSYTVRDAANQALDKIGPPALSLLRLTQWSSPDLEIRRRAKRLVDTIEARIYGERRVFDAEAGSVNGVAFSPDGKRAAAATSRGVRLWDVATGKLLAANDEHRDRVMAVAFSPDGKLLASGSEDKTVRLWDAATLKEVRLLQGHTGYVRGVAFSADGKRLVSGGLDARVQEWDVTTGKPLRKAVVNSRCFGLIGLADRARVISACVDGATVLNLDTTKLEAVFGGHGKPASAVAFAGRRDRLLTASQDGTLKVWETNTRKCLHTLKGHTAEVCAVAISPDGRWAVSGGHDKVLRLWDVEHGRHLREFRGHDQVIWCVAFSPDGKHALSGSHDGTVRLWAVGY